MRPASNPRQPDFDGRELRSNRTAAELGICAAAANRCKPRGIKWTGGGRHVETIAIILIVLWLLGMVSGYTLGNFIYVLLVVAIVLFLVRLISGRRVV